VRAGARPPADLYGSWFLLVPDPSRRRAGGLRADLRASGLSIAFAMTDANKPTAGGFPLLPGERLEAQVAMEWIRAAKTQLTPDQSALIAGQEPRSVLKYRLSTVLPPLMAGAAGAAGGITQNAVETRDALIQTTNDANQLKTMERDALISELEHSFFIALEIVVEPNAPLLLRRMKRECAQAAPYQHAFRGSLAWALIVAMTEVGSMLVGEAAVHDAALVKLDLAPLPKGANGDAFSKRVTEALELHVYDVGASHYVSRGPFVKQLIDELSKVTPKTATKVRFVPGVHMDDPAASDKSGCYPGVDGLRGGLDNVLRLRSNPQHN
jgi:hypothetical protein